MRTFCLSMPILLLCSSFAQTQEQRPIRFMLHGNMSHELPTEDYLRFVERVQPDILVMGVFDQRLYALAGPSPAGKSKPLDPVAHLARWKEVADRLHRKGIRLVGQMELFVVSDRPSEREQNAGWFGFYDQGWNDRLLGPRPTKSADDLLEQPDWDRHAAGDKPGKDAVALCGCLVNPLALRGCASNPKWHAAQKAMVKAALAAGVDGFMTNRNYFEHCACSYCGADFRRWLTQRYTPQQLKDRFGLGDVAKANLCVVGSHKNHDMAPAPLVLEKMRFAHNAVKKSFDAVYTDYARSLKPDVILAQWNHMAYFDELHLDRGHLPISTRTNFAHAQADERWGLPFDVWGKGESLFWYCNWGTTQNTILDKDYAGDTVLYGKLLRSMARGRPYVINKYDFYRPRVMMAEAAALGYTTNAISTPWQHEQDREVVIRYFDFLRKHEPLYRAAESYAEVGLVFPRRALEAGDASPLEYVEAAGRTMIRNHVLFDMIPDELLPAAKLDKYRAVVVAAPEYLQEKERSALEDYAQTGGKVLWTAVTAEDRSRPGAALPEAQQLAKKAVPLKNIVKVENARLDRLGFWKTLSGVADNLSRLEAPWTTEVHAYHQPESRRLIVHLVNYNHKEKAKGKSVSEQEAPLATEPAGMNLLLPDGFQVRSVTFLSPDAESSQKVDFLQKGRRLEMKTPSFLVYGVCVVQG